MTNSAANLKFWAKFLLAKINVSNKTKCGFNIGHLRNNTQTKTLSIYISEMKVNDFDHLEYSDYCIQLQCYNLNVSVDISFWILIIRFQYVKCVLPCYSLRLNVFRLPLFHSIFQLIKISIRQNIAVFFILYKCSLSLSLYIYICVCVCLCVCVCVYVLSYE